MGMKRCDDAKDAEGADRLSIGGGRQRTNAQHKQAAKRTAGRSPHDTRFDEWTPSVLIGMSVREVGPL